MITFANISQYLEIRIRELSTKHSIINNLTPFVVHSNTIVVVESKRFSSGRQNKRKIHETSLGWLFSCKIGEIAIHFDDLAQRFVVEFAERYYGLAAVQDADS